MSADPSASHGPARRRFCGALAATALGACRMLPAADGGNAEARAAAAALHDVDPAALLDRLTWGSCERDLQQMRRAGLAAYLRAQLQPGPQAPLRPPMPPEVRGQIDAMRISTVPVDRLVFETEALRRQADARAGSDDAKAAQQAYQQALNGLAREAAGRSLLLALHSPAQLGEQMTWFWFNHFNVHQRKRNLRAMVGDYEHGLRQRALGRFRNLLGYAVRHPAMLRYLDNDQNAAGRINENLARELLELHTLGVDGGYAQRDVQELARVLTGFGVNVNDPADTPPPRVPPRLAGQYRRDGLFEFNPLRHDTGDKQLLGRTIRGRGVDELDEVLDLLAAHPATARFVSRKLAQYLVADAPPDALVARLAQRFGDSDGDIAAVLAALFASPEFAASLHGKLKDPVHFTVSALRLGQGERAVVNAAPLIGWLDRMGQGLYDRQTPDGYPLTESAWSSPGQWATRFEIARQIAVLPAVLFRVDAAEAVNAAATRTPPPRFESAALMARLSPSTRAVLVQAGSVAQWNALLLSAPEFMQR